MLLTGRKVEKKVIGVRRLILVWFTRRMGKRVAGARLDESNFCLEALFFVEWDKTWQD